MIDLSNHSPNVQLTKKLLLIEDDPSVLESLRLILKSEYNVEAESTVSGGLKRFHDEHPALVVLDLRLADGEGLEVLRQIRSVDKATPVVVFTGYASMRTVEESLRLGASDYLHKPLDGFALKTRINQLLENEPDPDGEDDHSFRPNLHDLEREMAALKFRANGSAMFLHDVSSPVSAAMSSAHYLYDWIETEHPDESDALEIANALMDSLGFIAGLFEQNAAIECLARLPVAPVSVEKVVSLATTFADFKAKKAQLTMEHQIPNPGDKLVVNRFALARVLLNLLNNAVEAVTPGKGRVTIATRSVGDIIEFRVLDNGQGIPSEILERIFEPEYTTKKEGTGLGLYISRQLVASMQGTLSVQSQLGFGSCFSVKIPRSR